MDIFCRGVKPFPSLTLPQAVFWLGIMREHALFIDLGLPCGETGLKAEARHFIDDFARLEACAARVDCEEDFNRLVADITPVVRNFFCFKRHLLHLLIECRLCGGCLYPLLVDHLSREAFYFLKLLKKCGAGPMACPVDAMVSENILWVRATADHLKFLRGFIDPSERAAVAEAVLLGEKFDHLNLQARDLASMLWHYRPNNDLIRFERDLRLAACQARDFAATAESLVGRCAALAILPPLLADHVRREEEHFLAVLELMRKYLLEDCGEAAAGHGEGEDGEEGEVAS